MERSTFFQHIWTTASIGTLAIQGPSSSTHLLNAISNTNTNTNTNHSPIAYRSLSLPMKEFDVNIPVAVWYPITSSLSSSIPSSISSSIPSSYKHSISVPRIGQLLASIDFIPSFVQKKYDLEPSIPVLDGTTIPLPFQEEIPPIVFLAHGYLGSRFDLSHIAESLTQQGFLCISAEYPESLAASYPRMENLDRTIITNMLLNALHDETFFPFPSSSSSSSSSTKPTFRYGIIGHSLGCGTVTNTGDKSWVRVCIAGYPGEREDTVGGDLLFISSINDGAVSMERLRGAIPSDLVQWNESNEEIHSLVAARASHNNDEVLPSIPRRTALIFESDTGPNHISFLAGGVNNAMIDLLSPLLPVAQFLKIPVLDFDRYQKSQDSKPTADIVIPVISAYLKQRMMAS